MLLGKNQKPKQKPTSRFPISFQSITAIFQPILAIFHQFHVSGGGYGEPGFATGCHYARSPNTQRYIWFFFLFQTEGNLDRPIRRENDTNLFLVISPVLYYHFVCLCFCVREKEKERERARVSFSLVFLLLVASFVFVSPSAAAFKVTRRSARSNRGTEGHRHFRIGTLSRFALTVDGSADTWAHYSDSLPLLFRCHFSQLISHMADASNNTNILHLSLSLSLSIYIYISVYFVFLKNKINR